VSYFEKMCARNQVIGVIEEENASFKMHPSFTSCSGPHFIEIASKYQSLN
jgi:hypothetical protein